MGWMWRCAGSHLSSEGRTPVVKLLGHVGVAYPKDVRAAVLCAMDVDVFLSAELFAVELAAGWCVCGGGGEGAERASE